MKKQMVFCCAVIFLLCFTMIVSFADRMEPQTSFIDVDNTVYAATSSTVISDGIKSFQRYINNNLPMSYLGTVLEIDGSCGPLTKTAIIKLIQYRLNQAGAGLSVDGGFGTLSQNAFSQYVSTIERYDSGVWVYILQGLLYCHGYDPKGFDGSYGVNGGTGCLHAVNNFKRDNAIVEGSDDNGTVGINTMKCLVWRTAERVLDDGMYYVKNTYSQKYLNVLNGGTSTGTNVNQFYKINGINNLQQLWKITYVGDGYYSIRPMHCLNQSLAMFTSNNAGLFDISLADDLSTVVNGSRWKILKNSIGGYDILWSGSSSHALSLESNTTVDGANVVVSNTQGQTRSSWIFEQKGTSTILTRIFVDNSYKGYFSSASTTAKSMFSKATTPFSKFMNYDFARSVQSYPDTLPSDTCSHGYYNENPSGACCTIGNCSHNINGNAQCKCIYRISSALYQKTVSGYDLKTCFFTFKTCAGGLGYVNGNSTVVLISRSTDEESKAYMNSIRRI